MCVRMLVVGCVAALLMVPNVGMASSTIAPAAVAPFRLDPIDAEFQPNLFATFYGVVARFTKKSASLHYLTATWVIRLQLVDPAGAAAPDVPGSGAVVDVGCDNHRKALPNHPLVEYMTYASSTARDSYFFWHHGDQDGCDHMLMGPHGHQAVITVVVSDGRWQCKESYKGTNTDAQSDTDGTASQPRCSIKEH